MTALTKRVLVADNDQQVLKAAVFSLTQAGYDVLTAAGPEEALAVLESQIVHVAVIDLRLKNNELAEDTSGFRVAKVIPPYIPCIILTAYPNLENIRTAYSHIRVKHFISKQDVNHAEQLIDTLEELFVGEVKTNFQLSIKGAPTLAALAEQIDITDHTLRPGAEDVEQILRHLFNQSMEIQLAPLLTPEPARTITQHGSTLIRVRARYADGWGAPVVVKLATRDEIESEARNYRRISLHVEGHRLPVLDPENGVAYSRQIGGLRYSLIKAENDAQAWESLRVFGRVFQDSKDARAVVDLLRRFFKQTLADLFKTGESEPLELSAEYMTALHLTPEKLRAAVGKVLPQMVDEPQLRFDGLHGTFINPLLWAMPGGAFRRMDVFSRKSLCHGDLHGSNILVDSTGNFWLIDFARVADSHMLRDFAELETDIKFNLLRVEDMESLLDFERALLAASTFNQEIPEPLLSSPQLSYAYQIVQGLRGIASEVTGLQGDIREYYYAVFFHTLNIVRLQHIDPDKKRHALLAASLTCERLDTWMEEWPYMLAPARAAEPQKDIVIPTNSPEGQSWVKRLLITAGFMVVGALVFSVILLIMNMIQPTPMMFTGTFLILAVLIIGGFALVGLISGPEAVAAIQRLLPHALHQSSDQPESPQDPSGSKG